VIPQVTSLMPWKTTGYHSPWSRLCPILLGTALGKPTCHFFDAFEVGAVQVRQRRQVIVASSLEGRDVLWQPELPQPRVYCLWVCTRE
jgi:hypothetical protein